MGRQKHCTRWIKQLHKINPVIYPKGRPIEGFWALSISQYWISNNENMNNWVKGKTWDENQWNPNILSGMHKLHFYLEWTSYLCFFFPRWLIWTIESKCLEKAKLHMFIGHYNLFEARLFLNNRVVHKETLGEKSLKNVVIPSWSLVRSCNKFYQQ